MTSPRSAVAVRPVTRAEVASWVLYDWAQSAYSTIQITILMLYITQVVYPGDAGTLVYTYGIGGTMLLSAFCSPVLGALADARATKWFWLALTTLPAAVASVLMFFCPADAPLGFLALYLVTNLGYELSQSFYNGFLPEITTDETINWVSAWGFALGYIGGGLVAGLAILVFLAGDKLGLPTADPLLADYQSTERGEFSVAVPTGHYRVKATLGDAAQARSGMKLVIGGRLAGEVSTARGEFLTREADVDVTGDRLVIQLAGADADHPAVINALEIESRENPWHVTFDFGTAGSSCQPGAVWVLPTDTFQSRELAARYKPLPPATKQATDGTLAADEPPLPKTIPPSAEFGWTKGEIHAADAVTPLRLRIGLAIMGVWWFVFSLPAVMMLRDRTPATRRDQSFLENARGAIRQVAGTLRNVRRYRTLFLFLVGFLLYNDGIQTVITSASLFAKQALGIGEAELIGVVLTIQFVAVPGAMAVGWLANRYGEKPTLVAALVVWIAWLLTAFFITERWQFWAMAMVLAMIMGGTQSVSRAIMGLLTPAARSAEFFGFFNLSAKATSMFGPPLFGTILTASGNPHLAILSLLVFFVAGFAFVSGVNVARGQEEAAQAEQLELAARG